jgi:hypothetical protein
MGLLLAPGGAQIDADLLRCRGRLAELRDLKAGWHDGSGAAIDEAAAETAERFLSKRPFLASKSRIYPTDAGGVQFEFERNGWDFSLEFHPGGTIEMYGVRIEGIEEMQPQIFERFDESFIRQFDERVGAEK